MAKSTVRGDIADASQGIKELMQKGLAQLGDSLIAKVMVKYRGTTDSTVFNAIKNVEPTGVQEYKNNLKDALALIATDALGRARKEVPKKKNLRLSEDERDLLLSEFDRLPPDVRKRIQAQADLLVGTQVSDLKKAVFFQFNHSVDSTDSETVLESDLADAAGDYIDGASVNSGSAATAAKTINDARSAFFFEDDVLDEIDAFQFVNGDPVTDICQELAGTIFDKDDPELQEYQPPLHWNCKSYIVPILKGNLGNREITGARISKSAQDSIQFAEQKSIPCCKDF